LKNTGFSIRTLANPNRVVVSSIKQRLRDKESLTTSNIELSLRHRIHAHFGKSTELLNLCYEDCWIGRGGSGVLQPLSPDLTSHNLYLREHTKKYVYQERRLALSKFSRHDMGCSVLIRPIIKAYGKQRVLKFENN
jgi:hypothetical protein